MKKSEMAYLVSRLEEHKKKRDIEHIKEDMNKLYEVANQQQDYYFMSVALYYKAYISLATGHYQDCLLQGIEGMTLCEEYPDSPYYVQLCNILGVYYGSQKDHINSLNYFLKAYYTSNNHNPIEQAMFVNNIGTIFQQLGHYDIALTYFLQGADLRKLTLEDMNINDGIYIVNVIGALVRLKKMDELTQWMELYQGYQEKFKDEIEKKENETVRDDFHLHQLHLALYEGNTEEIERIVYKMLHVFRNNLDILHTFKNLLEVLDICLELKNKNLCVQVCEALAEIQAKVQDIHNQIALNERIVEMCRIFEDEEALKDALSNYYDSMKKGSCIQKEDMKKNLLMKIEMERLVHKQNEIIKRNEELLKNNELDDFTRIYHKESFRKHVSEELQHILPDQYGALFVIDIDCFKNINDTYGHLAGDEVLLQVANILKSSLRTGEYAGRIGGDEFSIYLKNIYAKDYVEEKAEQILKKIRNIETDSIAGEITASIGICMSGQASSYEAVFAKADEAMYRMKEQGKNCYAISML